MVINLFSVNQEFATVKDPTGHDSETNREKKSIFSTSEKSDVSRYIFFLGISSLKFRILTHFKI